MDILTPEQLFEYYKMCTGKTDIDLKTFVKEINDFFAKNYTPEEYDEIVVMDGDSKIIGFNVEDRLIPGTRLYNMIYKG